MNNDSNIVEACRRCLQFQLLEADLNLKKLTLAHYKGHEEEVKMAKSICASLQQEEIGYRRCSWCEHMQWSNDISG